MTLEEKARESSINAMLSTNKIISQSDYEQGYIAGAKELEKENAELKKEILEVRQHLDLTEREWGKDTVKLYHFKTQFTKAKEIIKNIIRVTWGEGWNYSLDVKVKAEQFLKE